MKSELPKVLHPLLGQPLVVHVIANLRKAGISEIIVVVGYNGDMVIDSIGNSVEYTWQHEQLGTGHAVMQTEDSLKDYNGAVLLACGDVPLITASTFTKLKVEARREGVKAVVLTMIQENPTGYGRIIKDDKKNIIKIVEEKDASLEEKQIKEVNTGTYIFDKDLLFSGLRTISTNNAQGEYYLPDVLDFIRSSGYSIGRVLLDTPIEGSGINSKEDLLILEKYLKSNKKNQMI